MSVPQTTRRWPVAIAILAAYLAIAAVNTDPLLRQRSTRIAGNPGDPILNTSILWWNATTLPFSETWWDARHYFPATGVSAFTENLVGLAPIATPIFWLTGNPLTTYNVSLFLAWPLSAFAAYLLVLTLTRRQDAAFLAGLAYGFSPYRASELGHIQMVSAYWFPVALLALHRYLMSPRLGWLILFGLMWVLQSLANGYLMLFGAVLIAMWIAWFCTRRGTWRLAPRILLAWIVASIPLALVMWKYSVIHATYGLRWAFGELVGFSLPFRAWIEVSGMSRIWALILPSSLHDMFPGISMLVVTAVGVWLALRMKRSAPRPPLSRRLRIVLISFTIVGSIAALVPIVFGPVRVQWGSIRITYSHIGKFVTLALIGGLPLIWSVARVREAFHRRSSWMFYAVAAFAMAVLANGPAVRYGNSAVWESAPYAWFLNLPGFSSLRVPGRFWMLGIMCLATAAALAFVWLTPNRGRRRTMLFSAICVGLFIDGWMIPMRMDAGPELWPIVEPRDRPYPILELPLATDWSHDPASNFRAVSHRRRVFNGASGHEPPHWTPLQDGVKARDPEMLRAISALGAFDVVIDTPRDPTGEWARYVENAGGKPFARDGVRVAYHIEATHTTQPAMGDAWPIASATAINSYRVERLTDHQIDESWGDGPQRPGQWITVDLGVIRDVGGVGHVLGGYTYQYPRHLAIDLSLDGNEWHAVWDGPTVVSAFVAAVRTPREAEMRFVFAAERARYVRLRQTANGEYAWGAVELRVYGPSR